MIPHTSSVRLSRHRRRRNAISAATVLLALIVVASALVLAVNEPQTPLSTRQQDPPPKTQQRSRWAPSQLASRLWRFFRNAPKSSHSTKGKQPCDRAFNAELIEGNSKAPSVAVASDPAAPEDAIPDAITNHFYATKNKIFRSFLDDHIKGIAREQVNQSMDNVKRDLPLTIEGHFRPLFDEALGYKREPDVQGNHDSAHAKMSAKDKVTKAFGVILSPVSFLTKQVKNETVGKLQTKLAGKLRILIDKLIEDFKNLLVNGFITGGKVYFSVGGKTHLPKESARLLFNGGLTPIPVVKPGAAHPSSDLSRHNAMCAPDNDLDNALKKVWLDRLPGVSNPMPPPGTPKRILRLRQDSWPAVPNSWKDYYKSMADGLIDAIMFELRYLLRIEMDVARRSMGELLSKKSLAHLVFGSEQRKRHDPLHKLFDRVSRITSKPALGMMEDAEHRILAQIYSALVVSFYGFGEIPLPHEIMLDPILQVEYNRQEDERAKQEVEAVRKAAEPNPFEIFANIFKPSADTPPKTTTTVTISTTVHRPASGAKVPAAMGGNAQAPVAQTPVTTAPKKGGF